MTKRLFIEGSVFASTKLSGIAYAAINMIQALCESADTDGVEYILIITKDTLVAPAQLTKLPNLTIKRIPVSARILRLISRLPLSLPMDLIIGRGSYIFPNFYNFSVPFSRSVTFIHDASFINYPETVQPKNLKFLTGNIQRWIKRSDYIATLSLAAKEQLIKKLNIPENKIIIVNVPIRRELFKHYSVKSTDDIKQKYKLPNDYILYVGNLEPRKNLQNFVEAFSRSKAVEDGISLVIVGADKWGSVLLESKIQDAVSKGASIIIPKKFIDDIHLPIVISGAIFLAQPSLEEGFGIPPTQALACGIPIIVSDIPVMHEIVGEAAEYFDPKNIEDITKSVDKMIALCADRDFLKQQMALGEKSLEKLEPRIAIRALIEVTV